MNAVRPYVVVVDDCPDESLLITRIFSKQSTPVDLCMLNDGAEALKLLSNPWGRRPALIIMDNKMPHKSGTEVVSELMKLEHIKKVPIVLMSAAFSQKELDAAYTAGVRSCVSKKDDSVAWSRQLRGIVSYWFDINEINPFADY